MMLERSLEPTLRKAAETDPVVILHGARAVGKTTLAKQLVAEGVFTEYRTFTNSAELLAAQRSPADYINSLPFGTVIDEAQLVEDITLPIKELIDTSPNPGRFLLTGSSRLRSTNLGGSDPLAGRAQTPFILYPLSWSETKQTDLNIIDDLFDKTVKPASSTTTREMLVKRMTSGGLPSFYTLEDTVTRVARFEQYFRSVTDLKTFDGKDLRMLESLFRFLCSSTGTVLNVDRFSKIKELNRATTKTYLSLFNDALLTIELPGWRQDGAKSELQKPKLHIADSGLAAALGRIQPTATFEEFGKLFETFVVLEVLSHSSWSQKRPKAYHWRHKQRDEVDLILEDHLGRLVCIEIKSSSTINEKAGKHIEAFREKYSDQFVAGYIVYTGNTVLPFGDDIWALPVGHFGGNEPT